MGVIIILELGTLGFGVKQNLPTILGGIVIIGMTVIRGCAAFFGADE